VLPKWAWSGSREQFLHCGLRKFRHSKSSVARWYTQLDRRRFVYDTWDSGSRLGRVMVECTLFVTHCLRLNLQLHTTSLVRTCRISRFCTVAWQLARLLLTRRIARSLGDSWASCHHMLSVRFVRVLFLCVNFQENYEKTVDTFCYHTHTASRRYNRWSRLAKPNRTSKRPTCWVGRAMVRRCFPPQSTSRSGARLTILAGPGAVLGQKRIRFWCILWPKKTLLSWIEFY